jgi:hypothetical protein
MQTESCKGYIAKVATRSILCGVLVLVSAGGCGPKKVSQGDEGNKAGTAQQSDAAPASIKDAFKQLQNKAKNPPPAPGAENKESTPPASK